MDASRAFSKAFKSNLKDEIEKHLGRALDVEDVRIPVDLGEDEVGDLLEA